MIDQLKVAQVILCEKISRGDGKDTPIRKIMEVVDLDGKFIAEYDFLSFTIEEVMELLPSIDVDTRASIYRSLLKARDCAR